MITIIEGPDACGKTTLAHSPAFSDHAYHHQGRYQENVLIETMNLVQRALSDETFGRPLLFDRLHIGEHVYGPVMRGEDMLGVVHDRWITRFLYGHRPAVVMALPHFNDAHETWRRTRQERHEYVEDSERYVRIFVEFAKLKLDLPVVYYDFTTHTPELVRQECERIRPPANLGPGIGHFKPGVTLLVGEQVNLNRSGWQLPFIGSVSGAWLTEQLELLNVQESELYWVNALRPDGREEDPSFIDRLRPTRVIALGRVAQRWCQEAARVQHHHVPHPQFWKRFMCSQPFVPLQEALCF